MKVEENGMKAPAKHMLHYAYQENYSEYNYTDFSFQKCGEIILRAADHIQPCPGQCIKYTVQ